MASYQVVAFKWTGTYYNATYNASHTAVFTDNDNAYQGSGDSDETVSIDGGPATTTWGSPYAIKCDFVTTDGTPHEEIFNFFNTDGSWYFIPGPGSDFSEGAKLGSYQSHTVGWDYDSVTCFANGTQILTPRGEMKVEDLVAGNLVLTLDGGYRPLRVNMKTRLSARDLDRNSRLLPVKIAAGALGAGLPRVELLVSRQHRMLVSSQIAKRMFNTTDVLIPAIRLTELPGCSVDKTCRAISYHHLVFDRHEVVFANGTPSESFYPGPQAMRTIPSEAKAELIEIFPALATGQMPTEHARLVPPARKQRRLIARHLKNNRAIARSQSIQ